MVRNSIIIKAFRSQSRKVCIFAFNCNFKIIVMSKFKLISALVIIWIRTPISFSDSTSSFCSSNWISNYCLRFSIFFNKPAFGGVYWIEFSSAKLLQIFLFFGDFFNIKKSPFNFFYRVLICFPNVPKLKIARVFVTKLQKMS